MGSPGWYSRVTDKSKRRKTLQRAEIEHLKQAGKLKTIEILQNNKTHPAELIK